MDMCGVDDDDGQESEVRLYTQSGHGRLEPAACGESGKTAEVA